MGAPHIRVFAGAAKGDRDAKHARCASVRWRNARIRRHEGHLPRPGKPRRYRRRTGRLAGNRAAVKSPWLGVNLDTGNFHTADPYADLAKIRALRRERAGQDGESSAPGAKEPEPTDLPRSRRSCATRTTRAGVALEYEAEADPWKAVPPWLAQLRERLRRPPAPRLPRADDWKPIFDGKTLDGWKAPDFSGQGEVTARMAADPLGVGDDITGLNYAGENPEDELRSRARGPAACKCTRLLLRAHAARRRHRLTFVVGGWGGALVGLSSINGEDASENETTQVHEVRSGEAGTASGCA